MPPPFVRHVFVCLNERAAGHPRGDCTHKGAPEVLSALKTEVARQGLKATVRAQRSGCLDACEHGVSVVVYPEGVWYGGVQVDDVAEIVQSHLVEGRPVARLEIPWRRDVPTS